jgi:hypothetical protein
VHYLSKRFAIALAAGLLVIGCGDSGTPGRAGSSALVELSDEAAGDNCEFGGQRIDSGVDSNGDGTLSDAEITGSRWVCNGADGVDGNDGAVSLVEVSEEAPGANCSSGGHKVEAGLDDDGDGALAAEEVDTTEYVCNGDDGAAALVQSTEEPAGANCAAGGVRIDSGLDDGAGGETAADGILSGDEIAATSYVCHGEDGADAIQPLVEVTVEPAGANCTAGGQRVDVGLDDDGDGVLSTSEISYTSYVCDGEDGLTTLVDVTEEPAGANCANGGSRVDIGADTNADGALDTGEIQATDYVCNGEDGFSTLLTSNAEPAGANCAAGGQRLDSGLDNGDGGETARDGVLGAGEIDVTQYVCDGADGQDADQPLVEVTAEPAGSNCVVGGQRIDMGMDDGSNGETADDGVLGTGEILQTRYVCDGQDGSDGQDGADGQNGADGTDGFTTLVVVSEEPAGNNCRTGGQQIDAGLDNGDGTGTARNGTLEADEIDQTAYVCNPATFITPGVTYTVVTEKGWSVRCLSWSGNICTRMQMRMDCGVCSGYGQCGVWHDVTPYNNHDDRTPKNWCALATGGDATVVQVSSGGTASAPAGCGYSSASHPLCSTNQASYHVANAGINPDYGLLLNDGYCGNNSSLMTVECAW